MKLDLIRNNMCTRKAKYDMSGFRYYQNLDPNINAYMCPICGWIHLSLHKTTAKILRNRELVQMLPDIPTKFVNLTNR